MAALVLMAGGMLTPATAWAEGERLSDARVDQAVKRAVDFLYSQLNKDGNWELHEKPNYRSFKEGDHDKFGHEGQWCGRTGLMLNALATAGQQNDPRFRKALDWLMEQEPLGTYAVGIRLELIHRLTPELARKYTRVANRDKQVLIRGFREQPGWIAWSYLPKGWPEKKYSGGRNSPVGDYSNSNYAVLGLWAAERIDGVREVPGNLWNGIERSWAYGQFGGGKDTDGSWAYTPEPYPFKWNNYHRPAGTMTAAGIASQYIVLDAYHAQSGRMGSHRRSIAYRSVQKGLDWMKLHFKADDIVNRSNEPMKLAYFYYNVERVGKASGLKYFGEHDWFAEIARIVLDTQRDDGAFTPYGEGKKRSDKKSDTDEITTALCMMFLTSGSAPVVANKLRHEGDWDNYLTDLAAMTAWLGEATESEANWQVVDADVPAEEWTDSRMLYISGTQPLELTDKQKAQIKRYAQLGGLLVFHPDLIGRGGGRFTLSVQKLLAELWPDLEITPVDLTSHPLGNIHWQLTDRRIRVRQLAGPTRVLAFILDSAPGSVWPRHREATDKQIYELGGNLHYFATDKTPVDELPSKLIYFAEPFRQDLPRTDKILALARIKHGGAEQIWNPEPMAWPRFGRMLALRDGVGVQLKELAPKDLAGSDVKVAHLTGWGELELPDADRKALLEWVRAGGTLIVDQAGGGGLDRKEPFHDSFTRWIEGEFGRRAFRPLSNRHEWLRGVGEITHRHITNLPRQKRAPNVEAVLIGTRPAIVYLRNDLTCGLLGNPNPLVVGVEGEDAFVLARRLVMGAAGMDPQATKTAAKDD